MRSRGGQFVPLTGWPGALVFKHLEPIALYHHFRAIYGTGEPFTGTRGRVKLSLSSTWGRADQQTSHDSIESGAFCFALKTVLPASLRLPRHSRIPA